MLMSSPNLDYTCHIHEAAIKIQTIIIIFNIENV